MMSTRAFFLHLIVSLSLPWMSFAAETPLDPSIDRNIWVGREPKDMPTLLQQFGENCERRYLPSIEKIKKPFAAAQKWTQAHCDCMKRFFTAKDDTLYVQIINLNLRDALKSLPPLPGELEIYLDSFGTTRLKCEEDPTFVSPAEQRKKNSLGNKLIKDGAKKPKRMGPNLPFRPKKGMGGDALPAGPAEPSKQ